MATDLSRRAFLGTAAASTAYSANDRLSIGMIGVGGRGASLMGNIEKCKDLNLAITAICDVYTPNRERAVERVTKFFGAKPRQTVDYQELLGWKDVDVVFIAAPDFAHSPMLEKAVKAGKDAYCEKPMGVEFSSARAAYLAVKGSNRVVQIGTQRRSDPRFMEAARLMRSGILGQVSRVEMSVNFQQPRWRRDYSHVPASDVAWNEFHLGKPTHRFDPRRLREWQLFREYTNGIAGLWMCHFIDLVHWYLDDPYATSAVAHGGVYLWKDGRETEDVFHALLEYPKGGLVSFAMSLTNSAGNRNLWFGTRGTMDADKWLISGEGSVAQDKIDKEMIIQAAAPDANMETSHVRNFLECVRSRQTPRCDIQAGFSHAVAVCMAGQALDSGRMKKFDRERLEIV